MATLQEIADEAGVSRVTVSNILRGRNKENWAVTSKRGDEVRRIAQRLGYRPNLAASAVATGRFGTVGLLLSSSQYHSNLPPALLRGLHDALDEIDVGLMVNTVPDEQLQSAQTLPKLLRAWAVDGLLIDYTHNIAPELLDVIASSGTPAVWINSRQEHDCVHPDDFASGERATRHLLELGHTRIAFSGLALGENTHYSVRDRRSGYARAMQSAGLEARFIEDAESAALKILRGKNRPTAIICYGEWDLDAFWIAGARLGWKVGSQLSLLHFSADVVRRENRRVTTLQVPDGEVGRRAVEQLQRKMADSAELLAPMAVPFEWHQGQSCGAPVL